MWMVVLGVGRAGSSEDRGAVVGGNDAVVVFVAPSATLEPVVPVVSVVAEPAPTVPVVSVVPDASARFAGQESGHVSGLPVPTARRSTASASDALTVPLQSTSPHGPAP